MLKTKKELNGDVVICAVCGRKIDFDTASDSDYIKYSKPGIKNSFCTHKGNCSESFENSSLCGKVDFTTGKVTVSDFEVWYNGIYNGYIGKNYDAIKQAYFAGRGEK